MDKQSSGRPTHPIDNLMKTAMHGIKDMVDVNTVVGDPVETKDGSIIIPISQVCFGFAAGGGEFKLAGQNSQHDLPFAGGSGAGASVKPLGFLVCRPDDVRLISVDDNHLAERLVDLAPQILDKIERLLNTKDKASQPETENGE